MKTIENITVFDGVFEINNPDLHKYDRSRHIYETVLSYLNQRNPKLIKAINKEKACLYINRYSGEWRIKNASKRLINRIFG